MAGLFLLLALILAGGFCAWAYYRREFEVRSRAFLLAARAIAVAGVVALLWNPVVPTGPRSDGPERYVVLDASASMGARSTDGGRLWDSAVARARTVHGHTSWHRSQPNSQSPIASRSSSATGPRCSMVR